MDRDLLRRLAGEAGLDDRLISARRLIALAAEECAKLCEAQGQAGGDAQWVRSADQFQCAAAIRAKFGRP